MIIDLIIFILLNVYLYYRRKKKYPNLFISKYKFELISICMGIFWIFCCIIYSDHTIQSTMTLSNITFILSFIFASMVYHISSVLFESQYNIKATVLSVISIFPVINIISFLIIALKK